MKRERGKSPSSTYLQTVVLLLQRLGVLGQADLSQPPGDGAIVHAWAAEAETKLILCHHLSCAPNVCLSCLKLWSGRNK